MRKFTLATAGLVLLIILGMTTVLIPSSPFSLNSRQTTVVPVSMAVWSSGPDLVAITPPPIQPKNETLPTIIGQNPTVGHVLTTRTGLWSALPPYSYSYQWLKCQTSCKHIGGATSVSLPLTANLENNTIKVNVTLDDEGFTTSALSLATRPVEPSSKIANASLPVIKGMAVQDKVLQITHVHSHYSYQWVQCHGSKCYLITGATHYKITLTGAQVGSTIAIYALAGNRVLTSKTTLVVKSAYAHQVAHQGAAQFYAFGGSLRGGSTPASDYGSFSYTTDPLGGVSHNRVLEFTNKGIVYITNQLSGQGSIELWFKPTWKSQGPLIAIGSTIPPTVGDYRPLVTVAQGMLYVSPLGGATLRRVPLNSVIDHWTQLVISQLGHRFSLYLDGQKIRDEIIRGSPLDYPYVLLGGVSCSKREVSTCDSGADYSYYRGEMDDYSSYQAPLTLREIGKQYNLLITGSTSSH